MKKNLVWLVLAMLLPLLPLSVYAADTFEEGTQYAQINPPEPTSVVPGKVEVVEMFWYGCPHCYHLEPYVQQWLAHKPANVEFVRVPAIFGNKQWRLHAQAYYTAEILGVGDKIHTPLFDAIHKEKRQLNTEDALADFFAEHGVDKKQFHDAFNSFSVMVKVNHAADLTQRYGISGVPSVIVDGKYRTDGGMAGGTENIFKVVEYLVAKESKAGATTN